MDTARSPSPVRGPVDVCDAAQDHGLVLLDCSPSSPARPLDWSWRIAGMVSSAAAGDGGGGHGGGGGGWLAATSGSGVRAMSAVTSA